MPNQTWTRIIRQMAAQATQQADHPRLDIHRECGNFHRICSRSVSRTTLSFSSTTRVLDKRDLHLRALGMVERQLSHFPWWYTLLSTNAASAHVQFRVPPHTLLPRCAVTKRSSELHYIPLLRHEADLFLLNACFSPTSNSTKTHGNVFSI